MRLILNECLLLLLLFLMALQFGRSCSLFAWFRFNPFTGIANNSLVIPWSHWPTNPSAQSVYLSFILFIYAFCLCIYVFVGFFFRASDLLNMWQHDRLADSLKAIIYFYFGHEIGFRMSASSRCTWTISFGCASIHPKLNVLKLSSTADSTWTDICRGQIRVISIHLSNRFRLFHWIPWKSLSTILSKCSIRNNIQLHEYYYKLLFFSFSHPFQQSNTRSAVGFSFFSLSHVFELYANRLIFSLLEKKAHFHLW